MEVLVEANKMHYVILAILSYLYSMLYLLLLKD